MVIQHRKLIVYQRALDIVVEVVLINRACKAGWSDLLTQLKRASTSIVLNIAEGVAEYRKDEKARFYRIALRSAAESHAALDVVLRASLVAEGAVVPTQRKLEEIVAMLVGMCKELESRR
jgi:four helix bundle protein